MWGAIAKVAGGALKGIGKGIVKGAKFLGRGAKNLWKELKKNGSKAKSEILEDASQKKKLGSNNHRFTQDILKENKIHPNRLTQSESKRELVQEFNLSSDERSFLEGMTRPIQKNQKSKSILNSNDPSVISAIEDVNYEEIIDPDQDSEESRVNTLDASPSSGSIANQVADTLNQHIYAGPASLKHAYEVGESSISPVNPEDIEVLRTMIEEPLRREILAELNHVIDVTADIEIAGQQRQLEALNRFNEKIEADRYLFLSRNMSFKNSLYDQSKKEDHSKKLDAIIAKYLVSKNGEIALTPELAEHLQILPQLADDVAAVQVQTEELDTKQNEKDQLDTENQFEQLEQNAEQSAKLDRATGILDTIHGLLNSVMDKIKLIPGPLEIMMLIFMAIDMIKDWWDENFGNLTIEGIESKIWSMFKKVIFTIWDIIKYMWWQYAPDVFGGKEGEFVWNGGDYYYKYKSDGEVTGYEYNSFDAAGNRVKQQLDVQGNVVSTEVNGTTYYNNGAIESDGEYSAQAGKYGGSITYQDNSTFSDKESSHQWTVGNIHAHNSFNENQTLYVLGGPGTVYEEYVKEKEGDKYNPDDSYVFITLDAKGYPTTFDDKVPGYNRGSYPWANRLFNYIQEGKYSKDYDDSDIDNQSELDKVKKATNEALSEYNSRYRNYTEENFNTYNKQFNQSVEVTQGGELNTSKAKEFVSSRVYQFDESGLVSTVGKIAADKAEKDCTKGNYTYTQDPQGRMGIYHGGTGADCTSYVTFLLREAGVNLLKYYATAPNTAIYKGLIEGTDSKFNQIKNDYGLQIIGRGDSKPDPNKLKRGDVVIFRDSDHGHAAMYLGPGGKYGKYAHMGAKTKNSIFELTDANYSAYSGGSPFIGALRFEKSDAYAVRDADIDSMDWTYSPDKEEVPEATGPEGDTPVTQSTNYHSDVLVREILKDIPDESVTDVSLIASNASTSHPDIIAEVDPNAKPLGQQGSQNPQQPKSDPKKDEALARQQDRQGNPVIINNHNYPAQQKNYQINPDAYLHRQMNDA